MGVRVGLLRVLWVFSAALGVFRRVGGGVFGFVSECCKGCFGFGGCFGLFWFLSVSYGFLGASWGCFGIVLAVL